MVALAPFPLMKNAPAFVGGTSVSWLRRGWEMGQVALIHERLAQDIPGWEGGKALFSIVFLPV